MAMGMYRDLGQEKDSAYAATLLDFGTCLVKQAEMLTDADPTSREKKLPLAAKALSKADSILWTNFDTTCNAYCQIPLIQAEVAKARASSKPLRTLRPYPRNAMPRMGMKANRSSGSSEKSLRCYPLWSPWS
jgi:hypothetical protein